MAVDPQLLDAFRAAVGPGHVITAPEDLRVYDCDGLTGWRATPACVVLPGSAERGAGGRPRLPRARRPVRRARRRHRPLGRRAARRRRRRRSSVARMDRILEIDLDGQRVVVEPGVANLDVTRAVAADGFFYAPDPSSQQVCTIGGNVAENSGGAHCLKNGFTVTHVTGPQGRAAGRRAASSSAARRSTRTDPTCSGSSSARRGRSGSRSRRRSGSCAQPEVVVTQLAAFRSLDEAGGAVSADHRGRDHAGRDRDDGPADDRGGRARVPAGLPRGRGGGAARRARRRRRAGRGGRSRGRPDLPVGAARSRSGSPAPRRSGCCSGRGARRRSPRWGASRPTTTSRTGSCRARSCRRCCAGSRRSRAEYGLRVGNVFHAGDGNLHPLVLYDGARRGRGASGRRSSPRQILDRLHRGRRLADRRARHRRRQGLLDAAHVLRPRPRGVRPRAARVRPGRAREPRQGDPDAAALRRGARAVPRRMRSSCSGWRSASETPSGPTTLEEAAVVLADAAAHGRDASRSADGPRPDRPRPDPRARGRRPHLHGRGGHPALAPAGGARAPRPAARARPARRPDDRRLPRGEPLRPAPPPLRLAARPRPRRDARARRRDDRELGRQGREERRRLRPRQARVRLARDAGADRPGRRCASTPCPPAAATLVVETDDVAPRPSRRCMRSSAPAERARRAPPRPCRRALRGEPARRRGAARDGRRGSSAASRPATDGLGREPRSARAPPRGRLRFDPGRLGRGPRGARRGRRPARRRDRLRARAASSSDLPAGARRLGRALKAQLDPAGVLV